MNFTIEEVCRLFDEKGSKEEFIRLPFAPDAVKLRIYDDQAKVPHSRVKSLDFEDYPFGVERWNHACELCGSTESFLDEVLVDDLGSRMWICSDTDYCQQHGRKK
ncbi:alpha-D-ribose 1-methylphosphonate 5-phosphate C-P-lyase PhnJ [Cylindrospermopsis raciborskii]|uniref:Uncharacterized protein n=1 Tax=Cylindrospermopsis raciborskii CS-505 TaxID=533240 RepID=A0A853ME21_9CYAN|nr:hypothetical protein A9P98_03800 [Cylindrospermopsis raciborskii CS-505]